MPQIQVIKGNPSFGTLLAQHLGQAVGDVGQGYLQGQQQKNKNIATQTLLQKYGITPEEAAKIAPGLDAEKVLQYGANLQPQAQGGQQGLQDVFNELGTLLSENAPGIGISPLTALGVNRKGVENRAYFDRLATRIEAALLPLVSKGALSKERFEFILKQLPKASDSQREILGKLKGLAKDLNLDSSVLQNVPFSKDNQNKTSDKKEDEVSFAKPPSGHVLVQPPNGGPPVLVPRSELKKAEAAGGKLVR